MPEDDAGTPLENLEILVDRLLELEADRKSVAKSFRDQIKETKRQIEELRRG